MQQSYFFLGGGGKGLTSPIRPLKTKTMNNGFKASRDAKSR